MKDGNRIDPGDFGQGERQLNWIWGGGRAWRPWRPTLEDLRTAGGRWHTLADRIEKVSQVTSSASCHKPKLTASARQLPAIFANIILLYYHYYYYYNIISQNGLVMTLQPDN
eukprot:SAG31_NODE_538_length_14312_cov_12.542461_10_plen_112_part_00